MRSGFLYRICLKAHRLSKIGYMITKNTLNEMKNADLQTCNKEELVDIRDVQVDTNKNQLERLVSFMNAIKNDVEKIILAMQTCLAQATIKNTDIDLIILTGGSTQIPYVYNVFKAMFPRAVVSDSNKMDSVGLGLAYDAMRRFAEP